MNAATIRSLLQPFLGGRELGDGQIERVQELFNLLQRWNLKTNLTAIRDPEEIVTRHFGESFFLASHICEPVPSSAIDFGSGAGFPGIPLAIYAPGTEVTLIESQNKKAIFLKEAVRALELKNVNVFAGRGETFGGTADLVAIRAVEKFEQNVKVAARLVSPHGRLALLISHNDDQVEIAKRLPDFAWRNPEKVPLARSLVLLVGKRQEKPAS